MSYEELILKTESILVEYTEKKLKDVFENDKETQSYESWIEEHCHNEFGFKFLNTFKQVFTGNIHEEDEPIIYYTGRQMSHLLQSIHDSKVINEEDKIIELAKAFVSDQVVDFHNWCVDVSIRMAHKVDNIDDLD